MSLHTIRPSPKKTQEEIAWEWDQLAKIRCEQIESGRDLSFNFVLLPMIFELVEAADHSNVVDIGCGPGHLTKEIAKQSKRIVGIDMSGESIKYASDRYGGIDNIQFVHSSVEEFVDAETKATYTLAISNMTLMTALDLDKTVSAVSRLLMPEGHFAFSVCHPWFWPSYWGYVSEPWFKYDREIPIEAPFKISLESNTELVTTHVHRPLHHYIKSLTKAGLIIEKVMEPMPSSEIEHRYQKEWKYPRFLGMCCKKKKLF